MSLPAILPAHSGCRFKYYLEGQICDGLTYKDRLYCLLHRFELNQRFLAYDQAIAWAEHNKSIMIQVSPHFYEVWAELKSWGADGQRSDN
jgi:hypothetical protein